RHEQVRPRLHLRRFLGDVGRTGDLEAHEGLSPHTENAGPSRPPGWGPRPFSALPVLQVDVHGGGGVLGMFTRFCWRPGGPMVFKIDVPSELVLGDVDEGYGPVADE